MTLVSDRMQKHNKNQKKLAQISKDNLEKSERFNKKIAIQIVKATEFYSAEEYHQDYYRLNSNAPYCQVVIQPKLKKLFDSD